MSPLMRRPFGSLADRSGLTWGLRLRLNMSPVRVEGDSRFFYGVAGVVWVLIFGAVVGNAANDFFGVVAARQGTLCVRPIVLGLAQGLCLGQWSPRSLFLLIPGSILRVDLELEIAEVISLG